MKIVLFYHSLISDWNHGNAHFLRGIVTELQRRNHDVVVYEPLAGWSLSNLIRNEGIEAITEFERRFPHLRSVHYDIDTLDLDATLEDADLVIAHEWNEKALFSKLAAHRQQNDHYRLLFHDTHHRSISDSETIGDYRIEEFDGVLAFGEVIRNRYIDQGWARRAWTWHEAADTSIFQPLISSADAGDLVWIGNFGDEERTERLQEYVFDPVRELGLRARVHGVRYPDYALEMLAVAGIEYGGWLPNYQVSQVFREFRVTVHVPRQPYVEMLPGIPTIRVFEALACGIPLICAPWDDVEHLFTPGRDYLVAHSGAEMQGLLRMVLHEPDVATELVQHGLQTIYSRHTCAHRVDQLLSICRADLHMNTRTPALMPKQRSIADESIVRPRNLYSRNDGQRSRERIETDVSPRSRGQGEAVPRYGAAQRVSDSSNDKHNQSGA